MKTCIININFSIHDHTKYGINASQIQYGRAIKIIDCISEEQCEEKLKKWFTDNGINILEYKNGSDSSKKNR